MTNNTGHYNTGDYNSGYYNSGYRNSGNRNSGNRNSGYRNSGNRNSGNRNSGHRNSGNYNSGNYNSGIRNSGYYNSGNRNSGHYNSGHCNSGFFCTETPKPTFFDRPTNLSWLEAQQLIPCIDLPVGCEWVNSDDMTDVEKAKHPEHSTTGGFLREHKLPIQEAFPIAWAKMTDAERKRWLDLPNFDAEKFLEITGVDVRKPSPPDEVTIDGVVYIRKRKVK